MIKIRNELPTDTAAIEAVTIAAFKNAAHTDYTEQFIIRELRNSGALLLSLVAEDDGVVIGHVAVSPVSISGGVAGWCGVGPISVEPECQGRGVGTQLMWAALNEMNSRGAPGCVVLGEPGYYSRFGFSSVPELVLPDVPPEYFQVILFSGSLPHGIVSYHSAFATRI